MSAQGLFVARVVLVWAAIVIGILSLLGYVHYWPLGILIGVCGLLVATRIESYLPFLGEAVIPYGALVPTTAPTDSNVSITLKNLDARARVVFWAAKPRTTPNEFFTSWQDAYSDFNGGVVEADDHGVATIKFKCPSSYTVSYGSRTVLNPHLHYRVVNRGSLMASNVKTISVDC